MFADEMIDCIGMQVKTYGIVSVIKHSIIGHMGLESMESTVRWRANTQ